MKKIIILSTALLIGLSSVFAQKTNSITKNKRVHVKQERQDRRLTELDKVVALSDTQKEEVKTINAESIEKLKVVRAKYKNEKDKSNLREEVNVVQKERRKKVKSILNDEQKKKWNAHKKEKKAANSSIK